MTAPAPSASISSAWPSDLLRGSLSGEKLSALVDRELARVDGMLFIATPRDQLSDIGLWQRLQDIAFAGQLRSIARTVAKSPVAQQEFVADEVALCVGVGWLTGENLVTLALRAGELPGLLESVETGGLTSRHLRMVIEVLHEVPLTLEQRRAIVLVLLARFTGQTPGELMRIVRKLVIRVDSSAAKRRKAELDRERQVNIRPIADGQGTLGAVGPIEQIAQIRAALDAAMAAEQRPAGDTRSKDEREFDLLVELICGKAERGHWQAQVVVPYSTAVGGDLELGHIPGLGAVLPSTARDLTDLAGTMIQIAVDQQTGEVLGVTDPVAVTDSLPRAVADPLADADPLAGTDPVPGSVAARDAAAPSESVREALDRLLSQPLHTDPSTEAYVASPRLRRLLRARDRTCVFPGCHLPAERTDSDHRVPYPRGRTDADNMQCLCRRHHRAKQASFTVRSQDGVIQWTTRGGWVFERRPQGY